MGQHEAVIAATNKIDELGRVFTSPSVTEHMQFGGEFIGETLLKVYQPGRPSYLAMVRLVEGVPVVVLVKRDAVTVYRVAQ